MNCWFEALGSDVPQEQRDAAAQQAREMGLKTLDIEEWVENIAELIERDHPDEAIDTANEHLDLTGTYRFLAVLCTPVPGYSGDDVARYECSCGAYMEFQESNFEKLRWASTRFGFKNPSTFVDALNYCCDRPQYVEVNGYNE
jgi:hypothetical protein